MTIPYATPALRNSSIILLCCLSLAIFLPAQAQQIMSVSPPFTKPENFQEDVTVLFEKSPNPATAAVGPLLTSVWGGLTAQQQQQLFQTSQYMYRRGLRVTPYLENLYGALAHGINNGKLSAEQTDRFLVITDSVARYYPSGVLVNFLKISRSYLENGTLFESATYRLEAQGGTFAFGHIMKGAAKEIPIAAEPSADAGKEEGEVWFEHLEEADTPADPPAVDWGSSSDEDNGWGSNDGWGDSWGDSWDDDAEPVKEYDNTQNLLDQLDSENEESVRYAPAEVKLPELAGPFLIIDQADLLMVSRFDTMLIEKAHGEALATNYKFLGRGGRVYWDRVGLPREEVFADLSEYAFNIKAPNLLAEYAMLNYSSRADTLVEGQYVYAAQQHNNNPKRAVYPRFKSYNSDVRTSGVAKDVTLTGGISLTGRRVSSESFSKGKSFMEVHKEGVKKIRAGSRQGFAVGDSLVTSPLATLTVYMNDGADSITHIGVRLRYAADSSVLVARKDPKAYRQSLFESSYHAVAFSTDRMVYLLDQDSITFKIAVAANDVPMYVYSKDFFRESWFRNLQGIYNFHPLHLVCRYGAEKKTKSFRAAEMAADRKLNHKVVVGAMQELAKHGHIGYNSATDVITIKEKGWKYYLAYERVNDPQNRRNIRVDFDSLAFVSRISTQANATLSLKDNKLIIAGVDSININARSGIKMKTTGGLVEIGENRSMGFEGSLSSGDVIYESGGDGNRFSYNYESAQVSMPVITKTTLKYDGKEATNSITNGGGTLTVSHPKDKAGLGDFPGVPEFDSDKGGDIYYDSPTVLKGAYDKRVVFRLDPYKIGREQMRNTRSLALGGTFESGGIFPDFREKVGVQADGSLGFEHEVEPSGYAAYGGKGGYKGQVSMNNSGLRGQGVLNYLSGTFESDDFIFYHDSTATRGTIGSIQSGETATASYPSVKMKKYAMRWYANLDSMVLRSAKDTPFEMYDPKYNFDGMLALMPDKLFGDGRLETEKAINKSPEFNFSESKYVSNNSHFQIKSENPAKPGMIGENIEVDYDLAERTAILKSEVKGDNSFRFPYTEFATSINRGIWTLDQDKIMFSSEDGSLGRLLSTNRSQDSLAFEASSAVYDLKTYVLNAKDVPNVLVANVHIIPTDGEINIRQDAKIDPLENAKIEMDHLTRKHRFENASVQIISRHEFRATADYTYTNDVGRKTVLRFDRFKIDRNRRSTERPYQTAAYATLNDDQAFSFQEGLLFAGEAKLLDVDEYMHFKGKARLDLDRPGNVWFTMNTKGPEDKNQVAVEGLTEHGSNVKLKTGLYLSTGSRNVYPSFLQYTREGANDKPFFTAQGVLHYDDSSKVYTACTNERLNGATLNGNKMVYDYQGGTAIMEGSLDLFQPAKTGGTFGIQAAGVGRSDLNTNETSFTAAMVLNFATDAKLTDEMKRDFQRIKSTSDNAITKPEAFRVNLAQLSSDRDLGRYEKGSTAIGRIIKEGIVLAEVELKWSQEHHAFYNIGAVGVASVFGREVDGQVEAYIEVPRGQEADRHVNIFLKTSAGDWYFIRYERDKVLMLSNNPDAKGLLDKGKLKGDVSGGEFEKVQGFVNKFRLNYLGIDSPMDLNMPGVGGGGGIKDVGADDDDDADDDDF